MHNGEIAIVGAAETTRIGTVPDMSAIELHAEAALNALADAGLHPDDVDGIASTLPSVEDVSHYLGLTPRWFDGTMVGGCTPLVQVRHAAAAISAGAAEVVLITHGESGRSRVGAPAWTRAPSSLQGQFELPFGALAPHSTFTLPALRFLHDRGMTVEALAEPVVAQREWAAMNSRAARRTPIDIDGVMAAPMITYPFTRDMCCVVTDGGGALVMMSAQRAADIEASDKVVYLHGSGEAMDSPLISQMPDPGSFQAFRNSSAAAFRSAGISHRDVDHLMIYDAFAHVPLYGLEDLGFVGRGESAAFIQEGHTKPGGSLPMNTNGGGMAYTHTGMYGMFAIQEAVRQLRGQAEAQVPGVTTSFVQGVGMFFCAAAALVLSNQRTF